MPSTPAAVIPSSVMSPSATLKPANNIVASLGIGMQALSERHQDEDPDQTDLVDEIDREIDDRVGQQTVSRGGNMEAAGVEKRTCEPLAAGPAPLTETLPFRS